MTSPLLDRPGAVAADGVDAGVAAHYGDPYREQRRLVEGAATVDLSHRPVIRLTGPDRLTWLHSLTTQHVSALAPDTWTQALVLSPNGHVEHHLTLVDDGSATWAHLEPGTTADLLSFLDRMRFMLRVEVEDVSDEWAVLHSGGRDRLVPRGELAGLADELAGVWAYEALRVAALQPRLGVDTDHRTLPNEVGWLGPAVHLDKGCYRGQETVARVHNLGRPPRRLALIHLDGSDSELPVTGDVVLLGEREVGRVGTAVRHYELGPLALGLIKRQVPDDADVLAGAVAGKVEPAVAEPVSAARQSAAARSSLLRMPRS